MKTRYIAAKQIAPRIPTSSTLKLIKLNNDSSDEIHYHERFSPLIVNVRWWMTLTEFLGLSKIEAWHKKGRDNFDRPAGLPGVLIKPRAWKIKRY